MRRKERRKAKPLFSAREVARLFLGEIDDPNYIEEICIAAVHDPQVANYFELLSVYECLAKKNTGEVK